MNTTTHVTPSPQRGGRPSTRRWVLGSTGVAACAAALAACGPAAGGGGQPAASQPVVELRTHARAASERDGYQKNVDAFNERYAGRYHATYEPIAGNLYEGQETQIAGGTIGDIHYAHQSNLKYQEYAVRGAALALDDLIGRDQAFKLAAWPNRAQAALKVIEGKVYGLPVRGQVAWMFLYWNRDLLRSNGLAEPTPDWTLDDLVTSARRLQQPGTDFYPVAYSWGSFETAVANVRRFGGECFSPPDGAGTKCTLDTAPSLQAFNWFYDHIRSGLFAPQAYGSQQFGEGKVAFYFGRLAGERGGVATNVGQNFEWTFDVVPKGPTGRRGGFLSIDTQQINSSTKSPAGAWELLKWLTNKESGINLALQPEGSLTPGFREDVYCSEQLLNDPRFPKSAMQANCANVDQPESYTYPHNFRLTQPGAIQEVLNRYLNDVADLVREPTPSVLGQLTAEVQAVLDLPRL